MCRIKSIPKKFYFRPQDSRLELGIPERGINSIGIFLDCRVSRARFRTFTHLMCEALGWKETGHPIFGTLWGISSQKQEVKNLDQLHLQNVVTKKNVSLSRKDSFRRISTYLFFCSNVFKSNLGTDFVKTIYVLSVLNTSGIEPLTLILDDFDWW